MPRLRIGLLIVCVLSLVLWSAQAFADKRVALVIGNSTYVRTVKLANPENDAQDLAETLKALQFDVMLKLNLSKRDLDGVLEEFERKSSGADVALFFFAGHGLQYRGGNYLLPVDANLEDEVSLRYNTLSIDKVRDALDAASGVKILILDACRNNPLTERLNARANGLSRSGVITRGLARLDRAEGMVVAYATQADQVAQDGNGRNSPFSSALIRRMKEPNLEIATLFRRVAQDVYEQTDGRQRPELSISLLQDFFLNRQDDDARAWRRLGANATEAELKDFVAKFPNSPYAREAENRMYIFESVKKEYARLEEERQASEKAVERKDACARESAQIDQLAVAKRKDALTRLKSQLVCGELAASVDRALVRIAAAEEQTCRNETSQLDRIGKGDLDGLKKFAAGAECDAARKQAADLAAPLEAAAAKAKAACEDESDILAALKSQIGTTPDVATMLSDFQSHLTCARLRGEVAAAIGQAQAEQAKSQQARQKMESRLAALEDEKRKAQAEAEKQRRAQTCADESAQIGRLADTKQKDALTRMKPRLDCPELGVTIDEALARLAASDDEACRNEAANLAALKSQPDAAAALSDFQSRVTCAGLRNEVAAAIKAVGDEQAKAQSARQKMEAKLAALEQEQRRKADAESERQRRAACSDESAQIARLAAAKQKDGLEALKSHAICPASATAIDEAIAKLTVADDQTCRAEADKLAALKAQAAPAPDRLAWFTEFQAHLACARVRDDVAAAIKDVQDGQARAQQLALQKLRARLATQEQERSKAQTEAEKLKRAQSCAEESAQIARLAAAKLTGALSAMKPRLACPELGAAIDDALAKLSTTDDPICRDEWRAVQNASKDGLDALKKFVAGAKCDSARKEAVNIVTRLEAAACQDAGDQLAALKAQIGKDPDLPAKLTDFQFHLACDKLRDEVVAAIAEAQSEQARALAREKVESRLKALEEAKRKSDADKQKTE